MVTYTVIMEHKRIAFGIVGILIGFVLGFFGSQALQHPQTQSPQPVVAEQSDLPEGHPPVAQMEQVLELEEHAKEHPEHVDVKIQLGNSYYDMRRFDKAVEWYQTAMEIDPSNVNVNNDLGTSYFAIGNSEKAIEILSKSLKLEPNNPVALQNLGWVHFSGEEFGRAIEMWDRLIEAHPDYENIAQVKEHRDQAKAKLGGQAS
jgi:cytochrome c-type biogenesis protein CcmH/NrfG